MQKTTPIHTGRRDNANKLEFRNSGPNRMKAICKSNCHWAVRSKLSVRCVGNGVDGCAFQFFTCTTESPNHVHVTNFEMILPARGESQSRTRNNGTRINRTKFALSSKTQQTHKTDRLPKRCNDLTQVAKKMINTKSAENDDDNNQW